MASRRRALMASFLLGARKGGHQDCHGISSVQNFTGTEGHHQRPRTLQGWEDAKTSSYSLYLYSTLPQSYTRRLFVLTCSHLPPQPFCSSLAHLPTRGPVFRSRNTSYHDFYCRLHDSEAMPVL